MSLNGIRIGVALTGSYCTYSKVIPQIKNMIDNGADITPIMSFNAQNIDTRFGKSNDFINEIENITGKNILRTMVETEPLGPKDMVDMLLIMPCTGNTMAKLANGISDTSVLIAAKTLLRINRPIVLAMASNDLLGINFKNLGQLMSNKNIYFVPFGQDNYGKKPNSMVSKMDMVIATIEYAIKGEQIQPVIVSY